MQVRLGAGQRACHFQQRQPPLEKRLAQRFRLAAADAFRVLLEELEVHAGVEDEEVRLVLAGAKEVGA